MNFDAILALSASIIILLISFRVWLLDTKRRQYRTFFILGLLLSWMSFGWYEMAQTTDLATALFWRRAQAVWALANPLLVYMIYVFADDQTRQRFSIGAWRVVFFLVFSLGFYFYYLEVSLADPHGNMTLLDSGHWSLKIDPHGYNFYLRAVWTFICYFLAIATLFLSYRVEQTRRNRIWKLILIIFLSLGAIGSIGQNYILPFYGVMMPINESANTLFAAFLFGWAMSDFKLLDYYADPSFEELVGPMPDLIILTSKRWNVQNLNPAAAQFFEQTELPNTPIKVWALFPAESGKSLTQQLIKKEEPFDLSIDDPDGTRKHYYFTVSRVCNRRGDTIGQLVQGTDLSSYYQALDKSKDNAEKLRKSNLALERFAYIASHDIKEPARTIANFVGLLRRRLKGQYSEEVDEHLDFIEKNSQRLHKIIDSILDFSRLTKQTDEASLEWIDMNQLLTEVTEEMHPFLNLHTAQIQIGPLPKIYAKPSLLKLLFSNLINNGIKFNKQAKPAINISSYQENGAQIFAVQDNGIGIDPEFQEDIFEMYHRLHAWSDIEGTGIGLTICQRIVEDANGKIWVESDGKKGTTFYVSLPTNK